MREYVKRLRLKDHLSQKQLGVLLSIPQQEVHKYESGVRAHIPVEMLARMARVFDVKPSELYNAEISFRESLNKHANQNAE